MAKQYLVDIDIGIGQDVIEIKQIPSFSALVKSAEVGPKVAEVGPKSVEIGPKSAEVKAKTEEVKAKREEVKAKPDFEVVMKSYRKDLRKNMESYIIECYMLSDYCGSHI